MAVLFLLLTSTVSVVAGLVFDKLGWADQVKRVRLKGDGHEAEAEVPKELLKKLKISFLKAWGDFKGVFLYMMTMFASIFKKKIIIAFIIIVFVMAVASGLIFNLII